MICLGMVAAPPCAECSIGDCEAHATDSTAVMKAFQCTCGQPLFFHNAACLGCGSAIAYDPTSRLLGPLVASEDGRWTLAVDERDPKPSFRFCEHRTGAAACNWLVPADSAYAACLSCRLTRDDPRPVGSSAT